MLLVGTGTVLVDNPQLNVRDEVDQPVEHQPLRVVMGEREVPPDSRIFQGPGEAQHLITRDPAKALEQLYAAGRQHVWLEGGPTLAAAFLKAGLIDDQLRWHLKRAAVIGTGADATVRLTLTPGGDN